MKFLSELIGWFFTNTDLMLLLKALFLIESLYILTLFPLLDEVESNEVSY